LAVKAAVEVVPLTGSAPDQPPLAVHAVAFVADQDSVAVLPLVTVLGLALKETVGGCPGLTVIVVDCAALPPLPVQVRE
jgi:hypothetical protein